MPVIPWVLICIALLAVILYKFNIKTAFELCVAFILGPLTYFTMGILIPRFTRTGHFYSVPFGRLEISDRDLVLSLLFWVLVWALILRALLRKHAPGE